MLCCATTVGVKVLASGQCCCCYHGDRRQCILELEDLCILCHGVRCLWKLFGVSCGLFRRFWNCEGVKRSVQLFVIIFRLYLFGLTAGVCWSSAKFRLSSSPLLSYF